MAAAGLLVTSPLILLVALVLRVRGGPVLRREARVGEGGRELTLLTFATTGELWGLAAVPQLWNVLRGDMSIVGPRPRAAGAEPPPARPGLTGLAQAEQLRRPLAVAEQLALDDEYARFWRPGLDARIVARTMLRFLP